MSKKYQSKKPTSVPPMKMLGSNIMEKVKSLMSGMHKEKSSAVKKLNKKGKVK